jgi:hypothetical protein
MAYTHGPIRLRETMTAMAAALVETRTTAKAYGYPKWGAGVGEAVVGYPETIDIGTTMGEDGADEATIPLMILAGLINEEPTAERIDAYIAGVKAALETGEHGGLSDVISSLRVASVDILPWLTDGGLRYALLVFQCEVIS